ncbi:cyclic AMP-dependent transcription factor ATF-2-like isoform X2 [Watersipora subatra]|uniref:cyclic AMP-dependent transcription factor ATF-2-like isoform X2 n=1 Tax=Watersipora subatra TaxID=2589382 RepID=UPI00355C8283
MANNDKPFACSFAGCNQKFITEDRLSCHMQKHDLNLESVTASLFTDQTPTPTTFLRDCENLGLFQDLPLTSKNPFDESFRKAVTDPAVSCETDGNDSPAIPILPDSASLLGMINTPTAGKDTPNFMKFRPVFLTPDIARLNSQISNDNLDTPSLDRGSSISLLQRVSIDTPTTPSHTKLVLGLPHRKHRTSSESEPDCTSKDSSSLCITPGSDATISSAGHSQSPLLSADPSLTPTFQNSSDSTSAPTLAENNSISSTSKPSQVLQTRLAPTSLLANSLITKTSSTAQNLSSVSSVVQTSSGQSLVMLHVNKSGEAYLVPAAGVFAQSNNKALPVKLSTTPASGMANGSQFVMGADPTLETAVAPAAVLADSPQSSLTLAKMKLKQALTKQHLAAPLADTQSHLSDGEFAVRSRHSSDASAIQKRSLSRSDDELDEEGKKRKTLQRNRDAARRCRKKKKFFIQTLEDKLKASSLLNTQLQSENAKLKMEIVELKSLFIAHKDCDVTKKQLREGSLNSLLVNKGSDTESGATTETEKYEPSISENHVHQGYETLMNH